MKTCSLPPNPSILVIKMSAMGDLMQALPCVHQLRQTTAGRITWVVDVGLADLLRGHPDIDTILEFPRDPYAPLTLPRGGGRVLTRLFRRLREDSFDVAIDLQGLARSWLVLLLARADFKIGRGNFPLADFTVPHRRSVQRHAALACFESLQPLGIPVPASLNQIGREFSDLSASGRPERQVCLLPWTTWPSKHWTSSGWARLADWLLEMGYKVTTLGGHRDSAKVEVIRAQMFRSSGLQNLTGPPLAELKHTFARSMLAIGVDSGPLHVARASGCPTISLYGASDPVRTAPWPSASHRVILAPDCNSCCRKRCRRNCLERLPVDTVIEQAESFLSEIDTPLGPTRDQSRKELAP